MHKYLPQTESDIQNMLKSIGVKDIKALFKDVPESIYLTKEIKIGKPLSEDELFKHFEVLANKNKTNICLLGGGVYDHYVPSVIPALVARQEFLTSYTPYQPEISQGTLQYIFEYQSFISELTGLEVSNASLYDGATATAEAMLLACGATRKDKIAISSALNPRLIDVIKTYASKRNIKVIEIELIKGRTSLKAFNKINDGSLAGVIIQTPNYFGLLEDATPFSAAIKENKGLSIVAVNPLSLGLFKSPLEMGIDVAVGDGQSLGIPMGFGGPYIGFMATNKTYMRKLPGRIVGSSLDSEGKRAFVLTLQAREQHIRREKATSNICSNESLMALWVTIYLACLGNKGLVDIGNLNLENAHYAYKKIISLPHFKKVYDADFFNEFVVETDLSLKTIDRVLLKNGYTSGIHVGPHQIMFAITERRSQAEIDHLVELLGGIKHV
ncbi:MAG: aminomethyl-transferring glycine dehydrogenase subunit GcvPA [Bacilli bacterium]|nr:aminomethyl-transferring glycine dehydrogenase subunit GcvPA [Bacilli bacterium]MDD3422509.1 aminomethyl-transferring glycine dehydrogenase subunit GcvPA [Bacilli bacterium]